MSQQTNRTANTSYPVMNAVAKRWSPRAFTERDVSKQDVGSILEAARWAASCFNEQPWAFIVGTKDDPETYDRIMSTMGEFNQAWAGNAPVLILAAAKATFALDGRDNAHAVYDLGQAVSALALQATELGLAAHQMAGFDPDKAREVFGIPEGWSAVTVTAVGYEGSPDTLPESLQAAETTPRERKPLSEFVFRGTWGTPAAVTSKA